jgi:hypothetical protein
MRRKTTKLLTPLCGVAIALSVCGVAITYPSPISAVLGSTCGAIAIGLNLDSRHRAAVRKDEVVILIVVRGCVSAFYRRESR